MTDSRIKQLHPRLSEADSISSTTNFTQPLPELPTLTLAQCPPPLLWETMIRKERVVTRHPPMKNQTPPLLPPNETLLLRFLPHQFPTASPHRNVPPV